MRILIFHGYLLRGTGSNIYTAELARALAALGHEVHLFCQELGAAELPWVDAVGRFDGDRLSLETRRSPARVTAYLPDIGRTLPVYVADSYDGFQAITFDALRDTQLEHYLDANVAAVAAVAARTPPDVALANHLVMGPVIVARAGVVPYAVKIHGSALEYVVRPNARRFLPYAQEGLKAARAVLVGSSHTARSLLEVVLQPGLVERVRLGPPGVDVERFRPRPAAEAARGVRELAARLEGTTAEWGGEPGAAQALRELDPARQRIVSFVGKLIVSKGIDLLVAAWPLVAARVADARLCVVGFGTFRAGVGELVRALADGDLDAARAVAARGRAAEGGERSALVYLDAFLDRVAAGEVPGYLGAARTAFDGVSFTGRLEHGDLPDLLAGSLAQVVPSTFPEAFGMVAAEAAACGALPLSAAHSGLAEVTAQLAPALPGELRPLLSFEPGPGAVEELAAKLCTWLELDASKRDDARARLADLARRRYGWPEVARGVIAAAEGRLDELARPASDRET